MSIHNLQLSHHSAYPDLLPRSVTQDNRLWCKPSGLWVSVDGPDDWPAFQRESEWEHENMGHKHHVTLAPDARILLLDTPTKIREFNDEYRSNRSASPGAQVRPSLDSIGDLLPTPRSADGLACPGSPAAARHVQAGNGSLAEVLGVALLPTPTTQPGTGNGHARNLTAELIHTPSVADRYGKYAPTLARWETILGRHAPPALIPGTRKLNPAFVEWMMGLPAGWVTDIPGLTRNQQPHALGNGVVPQQALAAITDCLTALTDRTAT